MRVLITGGAGFIGSHLIDRLLLEGAEVIVLDSLVTGRMENISHHLEDEGFRLVKGDVRDRIALREAMKDADAIIHLAALISVEESVKKPNEYYDVNVAGTLNVLQEAIKCGVKRLIYASSTAVYGERNPLPLKEEYAPRPLSPYAASKASAECLCMAFHKSYGLNVVILRYFNVYGPRQEDNEYSGVITRFISNAINGRPLVIYGDGYQTRDFIYVDDVVEATMLALDGDDAIGEAFNICTGRPISVNELAYLVRKVIGRDARIIHDKSRIGDIRDNYGDPTKARDILGFKARIGLEKGIKGLVDYYQEKREIGCI